MFSFESRLQLALASKPLTFLGLVGWKEEGVTDTAACPTHLENGRPPAALWFSSVNAP